MLFDWFTVFAQIANFLLLMWLLKRFLYKPVLNAIDAREKRIADLLNETALNEKKTEQQQLELSKKNADFAAQRVALLAQAKDDAQEQKQAMLNDAVSEAQQARKTWLQTLKKEKESFYNDISQRSGHSAFNVARKVLQDLSNVSLETQIVQVFISQLATIEEAQRKAFISNNPNELVVYSAMELSERSKKELCDAIDKSLCIQHPVSFVVNSALICGIELRNNGQVISWNINDYLVNLEQSILQPLNVKFAGDEVLQAIETEAVVNDKALKKSVNDNPTNDNTTSQKLAGGPNV